MPRGPMTRREYRFERDFPRVCAFLDRHHQPGNADGNWLQPAWEYMHFHPALDAEQLGRCAVWEESGEIVAAAHFEHRLGEVFFQVAPGRQDLKPAMLVGFFLAGLVIHGGVQGWWIAPILGNLSEVPLMLGAATLTAFNDNAAITYLATLVPGFTDALKYAVVAGAVGGGGLTIIANAPNPAGVSLLKKYFNNEVSPAGILAGALIPTIVVLVMFLLFK